MYNRNNKGILIESLIGLIKGAISTFRIQFKDFRANNNNSNAAAVITFLGINSTLTWMSISGITSTAIKDTVIKNFCRKHFFLRDTSLLLNNSKTIEALGVSRHDTPPPPPPPDHGFIQLFN